MAIHYLVELTIRVGMIYAGIIAGILLQRWSKADQIGKWLLFVGLNILTPLLLILVFLEIETFSDVNWWIIAGICVIGLFVPILLNMVLLRGKDVNKAQKGAEFNSSGFMNALFFPFPIIIGILPDHLQAEGLLAASLYLLAQTILRNTYGVYLGIHYGSNSNPDSRQSIFKILKGLILFPPTIGMIVGLILRFTIGYVNIDTQFQILSSVKESLITQFSTGFIGIKSNLASDIFRDTTMVIMLIIVGLSFKFPKREEWKDPTLIRGIVSRFGGGLFSIIPIFFIPIPLVAKIPLIIQSMAPPAVANSAYAKYFKLDELITSRYIAILTIIALVFLPAEIALLVWYGTPIL